MHDTSNEIYEFISRVSTWVGSVVIGIMAKLSAEMMARRKLTAWQWAGIMGISAFFGYISALFCYNNGYHEQGMYIVPVVTLMGERIMLYLTNNYKAILDGIAKFITPKK